MAKTNYTVRADIAKLALPILVERLGGSVVITEDEFEAMGRRYGGIRNLGVQAEYRGRVLHLTLVATPHRPPLS